MFVIRVCLELMFSEMTLLVFSVYMFLCMLCTPSFPDAPIFVLFEEEIYFEKIHFFILISILVFIYILITISVNFIFEVRFISYNVPTNLLVKRHKNNFRIEGIYTCCYLLFINVLFLDETASLFIIIRQSWLDKHCFSLLYVATKFNIFIIDIGFRTVVDIIINHKRVFEPCFSNFELTTVWIFSLLIVLSSDVHPNPGPLLADKEFSSGFLSFCNWNLNTLSKEGFYRISLLEAHNTLFKYDIISLCETSLSDDITVPENALPGYIYHPLNNPDGSRNGGVGIFYKDTLPLRVREDLSFDECLVTELIFGHKKLFFIFHRLL